MSTKMSIENNGALLNFINGQWLRSSAGILLDVTNPATAQVIGQVPLSSGAEVATAAEAAQKAFAQWRRLARHRSNPIPLSLQGAA